MLDASSASQRPVHRALSVSVVATLVATTLTLSACSASVRPAETVPSAGSIDTTRMDNLASCLEEQGWDVVDPRTGEARVAQEQLDVFNEDLSACVEQLNARRDVAPLSESELKSIYLLEKDAATCLEGLGYTPEVPSLQTYLDLYAAGNPYTAHSSLGPLPRDEWERVTTLCPPPGWTYRR